MKKILISEAQFARIFEDNKVPDFNGGDIEEYPGAEVNTTAPVTNSDGDVEYGKPTTADKITRRLVPQQYGALGGRIGGHVPVG